MSVPLRMNQTRDAEADDMSAVGLFCLQRLPQRVKLELIVTSA